MLLSFYLSGSEVSGVYLSVDSIPRQDPSHQVVPFPCTPVSKRTGAPPHCEQSRRPRARTDISQNRIPDFLHGLGTI